MKQPKIEICLLEVNDIIRTSGLIDEGNKDNPGDGGNTDIT